MLSVTDVLRFLCNHKGVMDKLEGMQVQQLRGVMHDMSHKTLHCSARAVDGILLMTNIQVRVLLAFLRCSRTRW